MPRYDVAHVKEQGIDLIIIPLDPSFGHKTNEDQTQQIAILQMRASQAGLVGTVVPVWDDGGGRMASIAPQRWHPFFSSINLLWVSQKINRWFSW